MLWSQPTADFRRSFTAFLNEHQQNNRYLVQQVLHRQAEFAGAETIAIEGLDNTFSPWLLCDGQYINAELGRQVKWLLVAKPDSLAATQMTGGRAQTGQVKLVSEQDLAAFPAIPVLQFDQHLNLTVHEHE